MPREKTPSARGALLTQSHSRRLCEIAPLLVAHNAPQRPSRSFDFGSAQLPGETHAPLAFAQDDGASFVNAKEESRVSPHVRHPERSEEVDVLSPKNIHPSAVEGPALPREKTPAARGALLMQSHSRRLREIAPPLVAHNAPQRPSRSFDFGSAQLPGETHAPLASAQDDGAFFVNAKEEGRASSHVRHPERSEAVDALFRGRSARAQSKDLLRLARRLRRRAALSSREAPYTASARSLRFLDHATRSGCKAGPSTSARRSCPARSTPRSPSLRMTELFL